MKKSKMYALKKKLLGVKPYYVGALSIPISLLAGSNYYLVPAIAVTAFFSWSIFLEDARSYKISNLNLIGLLVGGVLMGLSGAHFDTSILRGIVFFLIGWGMFQLFEGDIGGGDVRLVTVMAIFLNTVQILSAISVAAAAGMLIGTRLKLGRIPFGSLLIVAGWLTFGIVRF